MIFKANCLFAELFLIFNIYLKNCNELSEIGLNSDEWLTRKKGQPFMPFDERKAVLENLRMVDWVINFDDADNNPDPIMLTSFSWPQIKKKIEQEVNAYLK